MQALSFNSKSNRTSPHQAALCSGTGHIPTPLLRALIHDVQLTETDNCLDANTCERENGYSHHFKTVVTQLH